MKDLGKRGILVMAACLLGISLGNPFRGFTEDSGPRYPVPKGVYVDLNKDFYRALQEEGSSNSRTYSNDMSLTYLKEIAISARFMVETNLQILKNQERIIQMLESRRN